MDLRSDIGRGVLWTEFGGAWTELLDHEALGQLMDNQVEID